MNTTETWHSRLPFTQSCAEDEYLRHLMGRGLLHLLRGAAAALLMPIEVLEHLRLGRAVGWRTGLSWVVSAMVYIGSMGLWMLSKGALPAGRSQTIAVLVCTLGTFFAVIFNGSFQVGQEPKGRGVPISGGAPGSSAEYAALKGGATFKGGPQPKVQGFEAWDRGWYHRYHGHGHRRQQHHIVSIRGAVGGRRERTSAAVQPATGKTGVCCGDCRQCQEEKCLKTGLAKRRVTE